MEQPAAAACLLIPAAARPPLQTHSTTPARSLPCHPSAAFPSANYFLDELEGMAAEGRRLASPRLLGALRKAVRRSQGWQALGAERG